MYEPLAEIGADVVSLLLYALGTVALSTLGLLAEYNSLQQFLGGDAVLGGWYAVIGFGILLFALTLARDQLIPRLTHHLPS